MPGEDIAATARVTDPRSGTLRRADATEITAAARARHGVDLIDGCVALDDGSDSEAWPDGATIASATQLDAASLVRLRDGAELAWRSARRSSDAPTGVPSVLAFEMAAGSGAANPQPTGSFDLLVGGRRVMSIAPGTRPQRWAGDGTVLWFRPRTIRAAPAGTGLTLDVLLREEAWFASGYALLWLAPGLVPPGSAAELRLRASCPQPSASWVRVGRAEHALRTDHVLGELPALLDGPVAPRVGGSRIAFGDLHNHSGEGMDLDVAPCGWGAREELFRYARDVAGLDFFCLSEHDWQMGPRDWAHLNDLNRAYDDPGRFAVLPGFEWTSAAYGHRNVYFRGDGSPLLRSAPVDWPVNHIAEGAPTPEDLWAALDAHDAPALTVPHHMSTTQFPLSLETFYHPHYDRVAEIYSCWGDSLEHDPDLCSVVDRIQELAFIGAVRAGRRVGFIASSDSHDGHPGNSQGRSGRSHLFHHRGSGLVAALIDDLDRESVFDALAARRCYALTGGDILLSVQLGDTPMGGVHVLGGQGPPPLEIEVGGSVLTARVVIYRDGIPAATWHDEAARRPLRWQDPSPPDSSAHSYFAKVVRVDGEVAWSSPTWVTQEEERT